MLFIFLPTEINAAAEAPTPETLAAMKEVKPFEDTRREALTMVDGYIAHLNQDIQNSPEGNDSRTYRAWWMHIHKIIRHAHSFESLQKETLTLADSFRQGLLHVAKLSEDIATQKYHNWSQLIQRLTDFHYTLMKNPSGIDLLCTDSTEEQAISFNTIEKTMEKYEGRVSPANIYDIRAHIALFKALGFKGIKLKDPSTPFSRLMKTELMVHLSLDNKLMPLPEATLEKDKMDLWDEHFPDIPQSKILKNFYNFNISATYLKNVIDQCALTPYILDELEDILFSEISAYKEYDEYQRSLTNTKKKKKRKKKTAKENLVAEAPAVDAQQQNNHESDHIEEAEEAPQPNRQRTAEKREHIRLEREARRRANRQARFSATASTEPAEEKLTPKVARRAGHEVGEGIPEDIDGTVAAIYEICSSQAKTYTQGMQKLMRSLGGDLDQSKGGSHADFILPKKSGEGEICLNNIGLPHNGIWEMNHKMILLGLLKYAGYFEKEADESG